jgi:hypothetical protein
VGAVASVEPGVLASGGVGGEGGVAVPIALFDQVQLGAGVRAFAAHDHSRSGGVCGQPRGGQQAGDLRDRGVHALAQVLDRAGFALGGSAAAGQWQTSTCASR